MKVLLRILVGLVVLILALLAAGFLLPAQFKVERTATIAAPPAVVYAQIAAPKAWKDWAVWNQRDPAMQLTYSGPDSGVGAKWAWLSKTEGNGEMEFTRAVPDSEVVYSLYFKDFDMRSTGTLTLAPAGSGTTVRWTNEGSLGMNPINRWFGLFMDKMVGPDFEAGLKGLDALSQRRAKEAAAAAAAAAVDTAAAPSADETAGAAADEETADEETADEAATDGN